MNNGKDRTTGSAADDRRVRAWLEVRGPLERQLEPLGAAAMARLDLRSGERVLDVGCGIGGTPSALAHAVGRSGQVTGIDVLQAAVDIAQADLSRPPNVHFVRGDAEVFPFEPAAFDAVFSRFGVMFFSDPIAAFTNMRRALRPRGRVGFICWRGLAENELDAFPLRAASAHLPAHLVTDTRSSAHFLFADPDFLRGSLTAAGFIGIEILPHDEQVRSGDLASTAAICSRFGSLGKILRDHPELRQDAVPALERALRPLDDPGGPALLAATWVVIAHAPG